MFDFDRMTDRSGTNAIKWMVKDGELPMWVADMDFETAPCIMDALKKRMERGIFGYSYTPDEWYAAYMDWWKRRHGFAMEKDWLMFVTGVIPAMATAIRALTNPGDRIVVMSPVYNHFYHSIRDNGRFASESELVCRDGVYAIDWEDLEKKLAEPRATMMLLCNPQNPTGNLWSREELIRIAELCDRHHVTVFSDEIHCDVVTPGKAYVPFLSVSDTAKRVGLASVAPTKCFNIAGLGTAAVVICDAGIRERVNAEITACEVGMPNVFAVQAAVAAFTEGEAWLDAMNAYVAENKKLVTDYAKARIPGLRVIASDATYLVWLDLSETGLDSAVLQKRIREETGLFLNEGGVYGTGGEHCLRMNLGCPRERVKDGMNRLRKAWEILTGEGKHA